MQYVNDNINKFGCRAFFRYFIEKSSKLINFMITYCNNKRIREGILIVK